MSIVRGKTKTTIRRFVTDFDTLLNSFETYTEGDVITLVKEGFPYDVATSDYHLTTSGGDALRAEGESGYNVKAFGAKLDSETDDLAAFQAAINAAANNGGGRVIIPVGKARLAGDLYLCHDATYNPNYPSNVLKGGRLTLEGEGAMTRQDFKLDYAVGTILAFDAGYHLIMSVSGGHRGWNQHLHNLSIVGANGTLIDNPYAASDYEISKVFVGNEAPVAGEATVYISDNYVGAIRDLLIIGDKALSNGGIGIGLHVDPSDTAGGANSYRNITASFFDTGIKIGRDYDGSKTGFTYCSRANVAKNLQGGDCNIGVHFAQGCTNMTVLASWSEACAVAPYLIDNSARNIEIVSCNGSKYAGDVTHRGIIVIGNSTGTAGVDAAYNITVRNGWFFCSNGAAGVHLHDGALDVVVENNSFHNGGTAAIALDGTVGGELILRGNNYFPETAGSEVTTGRRVCVISGESGSESYASISHFARELDFAPGSIAVNVDASGWRFPPEEIAMNTNAASLTITLPDLSAASGRRARIRVMKPHGVNTIILDAQSGGTIKGSQTYALSSAYSSVELVHAGNGAHYWNVVSET